MIYPQNFEQKIGFDQIRQLVKGKCLSSLGEERVDEMDFSTRFGEVEERLELVDEFVRLMQAEDSFPRPILLRRASVPEAHPNRRDVSG